MLKGQGWLSQSRGQERSCDRARWAGSNDNAGNGSNECPRLGTHWKDTEKEEESDTIHVYKIMPDIKDQKEFPQARQ